MAVPASAVGSVVINEIYYNPPDELPPGTLHDGDEEFLELHNPGDAAFDLSGMCFTGFDLCFPAGTTIAAGAYEIVAPDAALAIAVHGVTPLAEFTAGGLSGGGELIQLLAADGVTVIDEVDYTDDSPWPVAPDGNGPSMELFDPALDNSLPLSWGASTVNFGTPGAVNSIFGTAPPEPITNVTITPTVPTASDPVTVTAVMPAGITAELTYKVMFGPDVVIPMADDGASGDGAADDGIYGATIPAQGDGELVRYRIDITGGGEGSLPRADESIGYVGYVVVDPDITTDMDVLSWFMPDDVYQDMIDNHRFDDVQVPAVIHAEGVVYDNVTFRIRGGTGTRSKPKVNFQVEMADGQLFTHSQFTNPVDQFNIYGEYKDPSRARNWMGWLQWIEAGHPFVDQYWTRVERNGDFYGLYRVQETYDGDWRDREGFDDGSFYKAVGGSGFERKEPDPDITTEIDQFWSQLEDAPGPAKTRFLLDNVNIPAAINWTAMTALTRHWDSRSSNFYMDRDGDTERWTPLTWDLDLTYTDYDEARCGLTPMIFPDCTGNDLMVALMEVPEFREMHLRRLRTVADEILFTTFIDDRLAAFEVEIADVVALDVAEWGVGWGMGYDDTVDRRRNVINDAIGDGTIPPAQVGTPNIVINELHYNPADGGVEFVELYNPNDEAVDISGWTIDAADLTAAPGTVILPDDYIVFTEDDAAFRTLYGSGIYVGGVYGGGFSGGGELVELRDAAGTLVDVVDYDDKDPWAETPDGDGPSLELIDPAVDNSLPNAWFPSTAFGGSPGTVNDPNTAGGPPPPPPPPPPVDVTYIDYGAVWNYLDDGSDQGTAWRNPGFDDSAWFVGRAELGYGDGDETTQIDGGPSGDRHITSYFRTTFTVPDAAKVLSLDGGIVRDDGAVVYLNGTEVFRTNMPGGTITSDTTAASTVGGSDESAVFGFSVDPSLLVTGSNVLAVEVHQRGPSSSDVSFNASLFGVEDPSDPDTEAPTSPDPVVVTPTGATTMTVSWATSTDDSGIVSYEVRRDGALVATTGATSFDDSGLTPDTSYEYKVTAKDPTGNATASTPVSGSTDPDTTPPTDPTGLAATATGSSTIEVSWDAATDDVGPVTYTVRQDGAFAVTTAATSVTITDLAPETTYSFTVQAGDGAGNLSAEVGPAEATTLPESVDPLLVAAESVWTYLDDGSDQGTAWRELGFDDSSWFLGRAELGYGDGDETTLIDGGPSRDRHITTYFRREFTGQAGAFDELTLSLKRDDGAVVYINGVEVARSNMPGGAITSSTTASKTVAGSAEDAFVAFTVPGSTLVTGTNVLAVEVHQRSRTSSDVSFDASLVGVVPPDPGDLFVAEGSVWTFLDNGSNQGTAWREPGFDDSSWFLGRAELGYGDGDEATLVDGGPSGNRHITTYFRRDFVVGNPADFTSVELRLKRDDGAVVYINGTEVARSNMPGGTITWTTTASATVAGGDEDTFFVFSVPTSALVAGTNVIAVEIHQRSASSSDISFDLALEGIR